MRNSLLRIIIVPLLFLILSACACHSQYPQKESKDTKIKQILSGRSLVEYYKDTPVFVVNNNIDLKGDTLFLENNSRIVFNKGIISNGVIVGRNSTFSCERTELFSNVTILGSWNVEKILYSYFTNSTPEEILRNITHLCSDACFNQVFIDKPIEVSIPLWTSYLVLKSNSQLILKSDIQAKPSSYKGGWLITINGSNIKIYGNGHSLHGDKMLQADNRPECLHAIFISRESRNIVIDNIKFDNFWGDGISSQGSNVSIYNIEASYNGRQGVSITNGSNILIKKSNFHHMGTNGINEAGGPGAGIDIEPGDQMHVDSVSVVECCFYDNYKYREGVTNDLEIYNSHRAYILVDKCSLGGLYIGSCSNLLVRKSEIKENIYHIDKHVSNLRLKSCALVREYGSSKKDKMILWD